jgi:hypothetical protein
MKFASGVKHSKGMVTIISLGIYIYYTGQPVTCPNPPTFIKIKPRKSGAVA